MILRLCLHVHNDIGTDNPQAIPKIPNFASAILSEFALQPGFTFLYPLKPKGFLMLSEGIEKQHRAVKC